MGKELRKRLLVMVQVWMISYWEKFLLQFLAIQTEQGKDIIKTIGIFLYKAEPNML